MSNKKIALFNKLHRKKNKGILTSKLQRNVIKILKKAGLPVQTQFRISKYSFDAKIGNLLIQVNGDFFHANPKKYKPFQQVKLPGRKKPILACQIWKKGLLKKQQALKRGYKVLYLWQSDLNKLNQSAIVNIVKKHLNLLQQNRNDKQFQLKKEK